MSLPKAKVTEKWQITLPKETRLILHNLEPVYFQTLNGDVELTSKLNGERGFLAKANLGLGWDICIPQVVREHLGLSRGDTVEFNFKNYKIVMRKSKNRS